MDDISNKTLAILLIGAMVVSLGGTMLSLNRLSGVSGPTQQITGYGTGTGYTNLTISSSSTIYMVNNVVDFGTGIVNITKASSECMNATLLSGNETFQEPVNLNRCWVNSTGLDFNGFNKTITPIYIRNDGNINVTLTFTSSEGNATTFIGGGSGSYPSPEYQFHTYCNDSNCCDDVRNTTWYDINGTDMNICLGNGLAISGTGKNIMTVQFRIVIPGDASGYKEDTLTFTSAEA